MKAIWGVIEFLADDEEYDADVRMFNMVSGSFGFHFNSSALRQKEMDNY